MEQPPELPDTQAARHWVVGAGHLSSAAALLDAGVEDVFGGPYSASVFFLAGFAIELLLKAAFLRFGGSEEQAERLRHDLRAALAGAKEQGFEPMPFMHEIVEAMREVHMRHFFRYMPAFDAICMPEPKPMIVLLQQQAGAIGWRIASSR